MATSRTLGLLLAAGAGTRAGGPKALRTDEAGTPWVTRAAQVLLDGGCDHVLVVLGAGALEAEPLLRDRDDLTTVWCAGWAEGMGASLRTGLDWVLDAAGDEDGPDVDLVLVHLVDLPDVGAPVVRRLLGSVAGQGSSALARAAYAGMPGHPVALGSDHWAAARAAAVGDHGARDLLVREAATLVECGDLASGDDVDTPVD